MKKIQIIDKLDLLEITKEDKEIEIYFDECCSIKNRKEIIRYLGNIVLPKNGLKKINKNTFIVKLKD